MYVIMVYDVGVERVGRVLKVARKYLTWVQNSVLEGEVTRAQLAYLKAELRGVIDETRDSVMFYVLRSSDWFRRESMGVQKSEPTWLL